VVVAKRIFIIPLIAALGFVLARCSFHDTSPPVATTSEGRSSASVPRASTTDGAAMTTSIPGGSTTGGPAATMNLSGIGLVTIRGTSAQGIVIRDKRTGGTRFFLAGEQAGECLDFLRANPQPTREAFAAACPGEKP
jgi:hypothetical protein